MYSHTGCIGLIWWHCFLHCVFSNVSSNCLHQKMQIHTGCICLTFLHYVFSNASSKCLNKRMQSRIGCIYLTFLHFVFLNVPSNCLHLILKRRGIVTLHNAQFVQYLYLATEQAGTYLKSDLVCHHLTYINPTLFSCEIDIENSILVSFKL